MLLDRINSPFIRANAAVLQALMRLIPFLAFGDQEKMHALVAHFMPYLDFDKSVVPSPCFYWSLFVSLFFCRPTPCDGAAFDMATWLCVCLLH